MNNFEEYGITKEEAQRYITSLTRHIKYVQEAGLKLGGIPMSVLGIHDKSKYSMKEFPFYVRKHYGDGMDEVGFTSAILHHFHNNKHHPEHWAFSDRNDRRNSGTENGLVEMPQVYAREMVADWMGSSMAYTGSWDMSQWLSVHIPRIRLHSKTAQYVTNLLVEIGYKDIFSKVQFSQ